MPYNDPFPGGLLQQWVIEWRVDGALNGETPAPGLDVDNNLLVQRPSSPSLPYIIEVDGPAGLFNPDGFGGVAASADRYIQWIRVIPARFGVLLNFFFLGIADASGIVGSVAPILPISEIDSGGFTAPGRYLAGMDFCPQGCAIQIDGVPPPLPGGINIVQMGIRAASALEHDALLEQASCCFFDPG